MIREGAPLVERPLPVARLFEAARTLRRDDGVLESVAQLLAEEARRQLPDFEIVVSVVPWARQTEFRVIAGAGPWARSLVGRTWPIEGTVHELALSSDDPIETLEPAERTRFPEVFVAGGIGSGRLMPLVAGPPLNGRRLALGVIGFWSRRSSPLTDAERAVADDLGRLAALLMLQAEAWKVAERSEARVRLRRAIADDVQSSLDLAQIVHRTIAHLREISAADRVTLTTIEGDELVVLASHDDEVEVPWVGARFPMEQVCQNPTVAQVLAERRPLRSGPFEPSSENGFSAELRRARHTALVPLVIRNEVTGLVALTRRSGQPFSDDEMVELDIGASVAALAVHNARLHDQTQTAMAARSAFLNLAAHELRTPFTVISGYLSLLVDGTFGPPPERWARPLSILRDKTAELGSLIDQILAASRAESGKLSVELRPIPLADVVRAAVQRVQPRVDLHGGRVTLETVDEPLVHADASALGVVLDNVLNNAAIYHRDAPTIEVRVEVDGQSGAVRVRDSGRGIEPSDRERIFEQFYRCEDPMVHSTAGTGLGLYIARSLTAEMGGTLTLEWSELDRGSEFALRLPAAAPGGGEPDRPAAASKDGVSQPRP
jgi:K+-sensing histidine kinase KdpD